MKHPLYRSRKGVIFGVFRGLADRFDLSVFWIRAVFLVLFFMSGFFPVVAIYIVAALVMKPAPVIEPRNEAEEEFYQTCASTRSLSLARLKEKFESLEKRTSRMENHVTNRAYDWERRFKEGT